jgi:2-C-methyl-D-erythritol 4-phosphate cytidylyltransferase
MYSVLITAAGRGERLDLGYNKVLFEIKGKTILAYSVEFFLKDKEVDEIILVINQNDEEKIRDLFNEEKIKYVYGGITRQESVLNGLKAVRNPYVFIHDGARPYLENSDIKKIKEKLKTTACVLGAKVKESLARMSFSKLKNYVNRDEYILLKTPQAFKTEEILQAHLQANEKNNSYTDDASLYIEEMNKDVEVIEVNEMNIKMTTKLDIMILEEIL